MSTVQIAEVQEILGTAYAVNADGERRLLQAGDALFDGESVETSEGGVVELVLSDGQPFVIAGQPVFLISADLITDLAPGADESVLQAETLDELLAEGRLESLEQIIESADEAEAESLDDLLAAAEEDPSASGIDFDNLAATAAGGDDSGADGGGSTIVQATRISASGDDTSATLTEGNTQAAPNTDAAGGNDNSISVAFDDAFAISEDTPSAGNLADNDALSGDVTFALLDQAGPSNGAVTLNEDGTFVFTPNTDFVGGDSFQYVITDANGQTSTATVSITVEAVNDAPVAVDDVVLAQEDVPLENINVLGNDSDSDGNPLTVTSAVSAAGGVVTINADGTLSYQAPANFTGADTINYTIADGAGGSSTAVVNIDVAPVSDLAAADDQNAGDQDTVISGSVAGNDTTSSGGSLTYAVESGTESGALIFNADGAYEYTPSSGFTGTDSFSYVVSDADSGESVTQTVILTVNALNIPPVVVNQAPIAQDDEAAVVQNVPLSNIKVLDNDEDPEGEALTVTAAEAASGALVSINADGTLNYTPNVDFLGADTVTYTIIDPDGATAQASLIVVVSEPQAQNALAGEPLDVYLEDTEDLRSLPAGATVTVASSQGSVVSISEDGVMSYQAPDGFTGEDVITYTTDDGQGNVVTRTVVVQVYPQSAPLVGIDDSVVTLEDVSLSNIAVLANDKIAEGSEVTVVSATSSFGAQVEINADGTLNYTPLQDFTGIDTVTYTARNGDGIESTATLSLEVTPENDPPVAVVDLVTTLEDTPLQNINVLGNDIDVDGDTLTVLEVSSAEGALVSVNDDGTVNYQPNANFNGVDTITYSVSDGVGGVTSGELKISVEAVNDAPVVTSEQVSVVQNQSLDAIAVLLNDEDPDGNSLSVEAVVASDGGTVEINEDGTLKYTPAQDYVGQETLTYTVIDGQGGRVDGQVTVSVASLDDGPVANEDSFSVDEDGQMLGMDVLGNDRVADGETLSVVSATSEQGATVVINDDGTLDYQAPANFNGIDVVTYRARDSQGRESQSTVTVTVNEVNDAPVALNDGVGAVEDTLLENINVLENDTDANNDTLTVTTAVSSAGGAVTINADGTLNYLPPANFTGEDTITYSISDGNDGTSTATVTVSVASINDTPVAFSANEGTSEETVLNGAVPGATDVDGTIVSYTVVNDVAEGLLTLEVDGSYRFDPGSDFDDLADGESRDVTFTYTATDNEDQASAPATITITVTGTSDVPVASDATQNTDENTVLEATVAATSVDGVIASYAVASDLADEGQGSLTFNADGSYSFEPGDDFDDLADGESREVSFTYTATDNNGGVSAPATVTITVTGTNDTPVAIGASVETLEDTSIIELDVLSKVTDIDGDTITLVSVNSEAGGTITLNEAGTINYVPAGNYFGSDTLTYVATDPSGGSVTGSIAIDIIAVNDAPVVVGETIVTEEDAAVDNIIVLANDSDIEGDALSVTEASSVNGGTVTINADGTLNYSPPANFNGTDTIEYTVTDAGGAASVGAVLVTVNPVDDQPIASTLGATTEKGVALEGDLNLSVEAGDAPLTFGLLPGAEPQHGVVALNDDGTFVYTPDEDFSGIERFGYTVTDEDGDQSFSVVTISVVADSFRANAESDLPDDVPVAASDIYAVDEDTQITGRVTQNDDLSSDGDGTNVVTVAESDGPTHGALTMSEAGVFVYTPDTNYFGADSFRYTLTDANGDTSSAVVTLNVGQVNDEAVFEGDVSGTMLEDGGLDRPLGEGAEVTPIIGALSVTDFLGGALEDTGPAGIDNLGTDNGFRIAVDAQYVQAQGGVAIIDADGNWAYTPNANFNGPDSFTVLVTDDLGNVESQVINVTVDAQADLSAADDVISVDEDGVLNASVADNDSTISGGALTYALAAGATVGNGELLFNEDGSFTYTPNADYYGPDSFSYVVTDAASGESSTQAVSITVNPVVEDNAITIDRIEGDSGVAGDFQTNDTTLTVSGSLEKAIASDERVEISSDGGETWTTVTVDGTNWSFDDPAAQDASFTFEARIAGPGDSVGATAEQAVTIDTTAPIATIELDSAITSDNVINAQESNSDVTVSGSVGGEARVGDTVTLTVNGVQSQASVESIEGALRFSVNIPGADLVADDDLTIDAAITTTDDAGNISEVATDVQTYAVDLEAFATITVEVLPELEGVVLENAIAVAAYRGDDLNVTGVTGLDAAEAGEITLTVNGKTYTGTVGEQGTYSIAVAAADLVDAESAEGTTREITVTVEASDEAGNPATASAATDVLVRPVQQVQFTDNFVDGVRYTTTSGLSGTTGTNESTGEAGAQGSFLYRAGDTITLTLGSVIIAEFSADQVQGEVLFLQDIAGVALSDVNNDYVENMAIFLQTLDADANADNGIQITPETAAFFEGYTDSGTGEALNIATAGKQLLANALTAAANAVDDQGNSLNLLPADFEFSADSETDQDGANNEGLLENTFETVALQHVADTIDVLGADRQTDLFAFDDRQADAIDAGTGIIEYAYVTDGNTVSAMNFSAYAISERTGQPVGLLANATPQQVSLDNMIVENVQVGPE
ncbi:MAG: Ig-like domain-containing protein, partial [Pseudomonadales bacterium]|nr:Ig-like domain-containing protein [Pseudomonadales bacterium]